MVMLTIVDALGKMHVMEANPHNPALSGMNDPPRAFVFADLPPVTITAKLATVGRPAPTLHVKAPKPNRATRRRLARRR